MSEQLATKPSLTRFARYKDLTEAYGVSRTTIWRWQSLPDFPANAVKKRGAVVLFDVEVIEAWLAA